LVKDLKQDVEKGCVKCEKLRENSTKIEAMHETLVSELKDELCRVTHNIEEEGYLEVYCTQKQIEEEFDIEIPDEDANELLTVGSLKQYIVDNS